MSIIQLLDESTINQIAAGEVVERPSTVVKELVENAVDAGSTAITVEIKEGGLSFIRITDNGAGIDKEDIARAFLRHATSKIKKAEDLLSVRSLGFRGEALSSIAAVAQVELITKTPSALNGYRYVIEGGVEKSFDEIGCPSGTTLLVRNIFFNTPARRKFLKSATTEGNYISDLMERLMVSHPTVSFKFISNNQVKLQSSGNNNRKDILYHVYGREVAKELVSLDYQSEDFSVTGFVGKPVITRGNRNFENYFINGRYIKNNVITKAIEEAYKPFMMQHKYPFTSLNIEINPMLIDVNVHPQKLEVRLKNSDDIYRILQHIIRESLMEREMIPRVSLSKQEDKKEKPVGLPEPFETKRRNQIEQSLPKPGDLIRRERDVLRNTEDLKMNGPSVANGPTIYEKKFIDSKLAEELGYKANQTISGTVNVDNSELISANHAMNSEIATKVKNDFYQDNKGDFLNKTDYLTEQNNDSKIQIESTVSENPPENAHKDSVLHMSNGVVAEKTAQRDEPFNNSTSVVQVEGKGQITLFDDMEQEQPFISQKAFEGHRVIGQVFATYWMIEYKKDLFIIDQHAAHEKVLYEKIMVASREKQFESQMLMPPIVLSLTLREQEVLKKYESSLNQLGYEFEHFGGNEYSVRAVPTDLYSISERDLLIEFIDNLADEVGVTTPDAILDRVASLSCKAAVKANHVLSHTEAVALIEELLTLENPYHCPHGRPIIISMSQYELEKKFKRIV